MANSSFSASNTDNQYDTPIPTRWVGPVDIQFNLNPLTTTNSQQQQSSSRPNLESCELPLATFEIPMWPSVRRGARVFSASGGITGNLISESMTRSISFRTANSMQALQVVADIDNHLPSLQQIIGEQSRFTRLQSVHSEIIGNLIYLRLSFNTADASGHNMVTLAAERIQQWLLAYYPNLEYSSISGNICVDKKNSAINGILGRGKNVIADAVIPEKIIKRYLHTTAEKIVTLNTEKNLIGSIAAGSVRSANAHYANMLLAFYLALGQDGANVVEGSQGITHTELRGEHNQDLYFSVTLPNIIIGTVGNGKHLPVARQALTRLGCLEERSVGENSQRLAILAGVTVACGELSLLAAQTNPGELTQAHIKLERSAQ